MELKTEFNLIEGLNMLANFDEPTEFEEYAATLATMLAELMENSAVCNMVATLAPDELIRLSPWMPQIGGMFPPKSMNWFEWIDGVQRT